MDVKSFLLSCTQRRVRVDVVPERGDVYLIAEPDMGGREPFHVGAAVALVFNLAGGVNRATTAAGSFGPARVELCVRVAAGYRDWCFDLEGELSLAGAKATVDAVAGVNREGLTWPEWLAAAGGCSVWQHVLADLKKGWEAGEVIDMAAQLAEDVQNLHEWLMKGGFLPAIWEANRPKVATNNRTIDVVFDGPPGPEAGRFVEVESPPGTSISFGAWVDRGDGYWVLRFSEGGDHV